MSKVLKLHTSPLRVQIVRLGRPARAAAVPAFTPLAGSEHQDDPGVTQTVVEEGGAVAIVHAPVVNEFEQGYKEGWAAAEARLREEHRIVIAKEKARVDTLLTSVSEQIASFQEKAEQTAIRFALAVAERIIQREVKLDNQIVLHDIKEALRRVLGAERVTIHVNPAEEETVRSHRAAIVSSSESVREVLIEADETIAPGGCIIESTSGNVDARIETQIKKIEASIFGQG